MRKPSEQVNRNLIIHSNIKLEYQIGKSVPFLDLLHHKNNGILSSSVYHKPAAEPSILSFLSDHPRHVFRNVVQTALMRAVRYSSSFEAFNIERRTIRSMLLYNGYPSTYINEQFQQFFVKYISLSSFILPLIENAAQFSVLRDKLLAQPTIKQAIVAKSAAAVDISTNDPIVQNIAQTNTRTTKMTVKENNDKFKNALFIHCIHEARLEGLKRYIYEIHDSFYKGTPNEDIRLIVGHHNNPNIEFELARKRPRSSLLKNIPNKKPKHNEPVPTA